MLRVPGRDLTIVDFTLRPLLTDGDSQSGFVLSLRDAAERIETISLSASLNEEKSFDCAQQGMVQLDASGRVMRREPGPTFEILAFLWNLSLAEDSRSCLPIRSHGYPDNSCICCCSRARGQASIFNNRQRHTRNA